MKKLLPLALLLLSLFSNLAVTTSHASINNKIVNTNMDISKIVEIATENNIILHLNSLTSINKEQKKEIVNTVNTMYLEGLTETVVSKNTSGLSSNLITPYAIDGSIRKRTLSGFYTGSKTIEGVGIPEYTLLVQVNCDVYSDSTTKQILSVYEGEISSYLYKGIGSYSQYDQWYAIPSNRAYVKVSGQGLYTIGVLNLPIPFSVNIYP